MDTTQHGITLKEISSKGGKFRITYMAYISQLNCSASELPSQRNR
jgi:hypothetical protein